jgi:hypothetical protein
MSEQHNRDALGRYRQEFFERQNMAPIDDLMHDDYRVSSVRRKDSRQGQSVDRL